MAVNPPAHLTCAVCLEAPVGRVEQCARGHIICAQPTEGPQTEPCCLDKLRKDAAALSGAARCPMCRISMPSELTRCLVAEQAIKLLFSRCIYCKSDVTLDELPNHEESCLCGPDLRCVAAEAGCAWVGKLAGSRVHKSHCALAIQHEAWMLKFEAEKEARIAGDVAMGEYLASAWLWNTQRSNLLYLAAIHNNVVVLEAMAKVSRVGVNDSRVKDGETPLCGAARCGNTEAVRVLLQAGALPSVGSGPSGTPPLYLAAEEGHRETVLVLLAGGANINIRRKLDDATPLHAACRAGRFDMCDLLCRKGASPISGETGAARASRRCFWMLSLPME